MVIKNKNIKYFKMYQSIVFSLRILYQVSLQSIQIVYLLYFNINVKNKENGKVVQFVNIFEIMNNYCSYSLKIFFSQYY